MVTKGVAEVEGEVAAILLLFGQKARLTRVLTLKSRCSLRVLDHEVTAQAGPTTCLQTAAW